MNHNELKLNVIRKNISGCAACDAVGFNVCRCKKGGGGSGGNGPEEDREKNEKSLQATNSPSSPALTPQSNILKIAVSSNNDFIHNLNELNTLKLNYLLEVKKVFDEFKNELKRQGNDVQPYEAAIVEDKLHLQIPNSEHHDAFLENLQNINMLPRPEPANNVADVENKENMSCTSDNRLVNPFAIPKCTPPGF